MSENSRTAGNVVQRRRHWSDAHRSATKKAAMAGGFPLAVADGACAPAPMRLGACRRLARARIVSAARPAVSRNLWRNCNESQRAPATALNAPGAGGRALYQSLCTPATADAPSTRGPDRSALSRGYVGATKKNVAVMTAMQATITASACQPVIPSGWRVLMPRAPPCALESARARLRATPRDRAAAAVCAKH